MNGIQPALVAILSAMALGELAGCGVAVRGTPVSMTATHSPAKPAVTADTLACGQPAMAAFAERAMGPNGGWLAGASKNMIDRVQCGLAAKASNNAEANPARPADVPKSDTADLNHDGFVTLDEVLAMNRVLPRDQVIARLKNFGGVFSLNRTQQQYLLDRGVPLEVIAVMTDPAPVIAKLTPTH